MTSPVSRLEPPIVTSTMSVPPQTTRPTPPTRVEPSTIAELRHAIEQQRDAVDAFWARVDETGTPLIEPIQDDPEHVVLTWLWRGGDDIADVVLDANKIVDPATYETTQLERIAGTDVWYVGLRLGAGWRGSYALAAVPVTGGEPTVTDTELADMELRRAWVAEVADPAVVPSWHRWFDSIRFRRRDPRAREQLDASWSVAAGPQAPAQPHLGRRNDVTTGAVVQHGLLDPVSGEPRALWTYSPAGHTDGCPLLVVLDGEQWLRLGIADTFDQLIADAVVPPFAAVLISSRTTAGRVEDLTCNPAFVSFMADEVVPAARQWTRCGTRTTVAGKSLGGLTALFATFRRPDMFDAAIVMSGSFWWPNTGDPATREWLTTQVTDQPQLPTRVHVDVGLQEWVLLEPTRRMAQALTARGIEIQYREFDGGHDPACWRGGLANGVIWTLGTEPSVPHQR